MTCPLTIDLGAYLLGALDPAEDERLREHLRGCPECRAEHELLRGLPGRLGLLAPHDLDGLGTTEPSTAPFGGFLRRAGEDPRRRSRRRVSVGLSAAAAVLAAAVAGGVGVTGGSPPAPGPITVAAANEVSQVRASARLTSHGWGTQVALRLSGVAPGQRCVLVARARDGRRETAASWVAAYDGTAHIQGTTAIPRDQLGRLDIVTASGRRLLTIPTTTRGPV
jgi:anti-sigma factor RsiW